MILPDWCANPNEVLANQRVWYQIVIDAERRSPHKAQPLQFVPQDEVARLLPKTRTKQFVYFGRNPSDK